MKLHAKLSLGSGWVERPSGSAMPPMAFAVLDATRCERGDGQARDQDFGGDYELRCPNTVACKLLDVGAGERKHMARDINDFIDALPPTRRVKIEKHAAELIKQTKISQKPKPSATKMTSK